jgi:CBS domain-containing protein
MHTIEAVRRSGVGIDPGTTVREAAAVMERSGVGALAVIDGSRLVGIVTDRDLVRRGLARGVPCDARVDGLMSTPVVTIDAHADLHDAFVLLRSRGVRRLAVVRGGEFVGVLTVDDMLVNLAQDLADLTRPVVGEMEKSHRDAAVPAIR